jgi:putative endonuclease
MSEAKNRTMNRRTRMYYFYILRCSDNTLYSGQTNNLEERVKIHNTDNSKSAKYTKYRRPVKLIYFEEYQTLQEAMKREHQVKKWTKIKKEALVNNDLELLRKL